MVEPAKKKKMPNVQFKTAWKFPETGGKSRKKRKKPAGCGNFRKESKKAGHSRIRDQKAAANEGRVSPVGCTAKPETPRVC